ncbi:MAG: Rieske 2Fe-2S domain-containing protein [Rhodocyclaceae bacterium]|nr:Rieske 2Fe-2S domain-containing protein [Rhodocyclaceae bacterium]
MAEKTRMICASDSLANGGKGIRFEIATECGPQSAFVVRHDGKAYAYLNRCAHIGIELDWRPGEFFDDSRLYLVCATHGATYQPDTGTCIAGPCRGARLTQLAVYEQDGGVYLNRD